jgi:hypothetical protein
VGFVMAMLASEARSHGCTLRLSNVSLSCLTMLESEAGLDMAETGAVFRGLILDKVFSDNLEDASRFVSSGGDTLLFFLGLTSTRSSSGPEPMLESSWSEDAALESEGVERAIVGSESTIF